MTLRNIAIAVALVAAPSAASAATMTFSGLPTSVGGPATYTEDGITVTSASGQFWAWPAAGQLHMDPSGFAGPTFTFTTGGAFTPVATTVSYAGGGTLTFQGYDASSTLLGTLVFAAPAEGTVLDLTSLGSIYSLVMTDTVAHMSVDDFVVRAAGGGGGVPEPATWAMMIGGFGLVGGAMRRRSARVRFA